ncbi:hypothetical protein GQ56_0106765 [Burkholderia paludis]|nr:hypothetical protein GQ56_0106765 [Burkholderia paludis]
MMEDARSPVDEHVVSLTGKMRLRICYLAPPSGDPHCSDGCAEIDNLIAERALRGVAIDRRNYLYAGADAGGERAAAMYSLIGTARLNGLAREAYLAYVLERIADHPVSWIDELMPWRVAPLLPSTARVEPIR